MRLGRTHRVIDKFSGCLGVNQMNKINKLVRPASEERSGTKLI